MTKGPRWERVSIDPFCQCDEMHRGEATKKKTNNSFVSCCFSDVFLALCFTCNTIRICALFAVVMSWSCGTRLSDYSSESMACRDEKFFDNLTMWNHCVSLVASYTKCLPQTFWMCFAPTACEKKCCVL